MKHDYSDELRHFGVKGMKWGVRKSQKRREKYLNKTERMSKIHDTNAKTYSRSAKQLKSMSDRDYAKRFDDPEYLEILGGAKKAKSEEIKDYEDRARNSVEYAKQWMAAHDKILSMPVDSLKSDRDYRRIINDELNKGLAN